MIGVYHPSNTITYVGVAAAAAGTGLAVQGQAAIAMTLLVVCGLTDLFDGAFARRFTRTDYQRAFGVQLDSLVDCVCFLAFPLVLVISLGLTAWWQLVILVLYAFAGVTRLAAFNAAAVEKSSPDPIRFYRGLPVTYVALILPVVFLIWRTLSSQAAGWYFSATMLACGIAFVIDFPMPKPRGVAYVIFGLLAIAVAGAILWWS